LKKQQSMARWLMDQWFLLKFKPPKKTLEFADSSSKPIQDWLKFLRKELNDQESVPPDANARHTDAPDPLSLAGLKLDLEKVNLSQILNPSTPRSAPDSVNTSPREKGSGPKSPRSKDSVRRDKESSTNLKKDSKKAISHRDKRSATSTPRKDSARGLNRKAQAVSTSISPRDTPIPNYVPKNWLAKEIQNSGSSPLVLGSQKTNQLLGNTMVEKQQDRLYVWNMETGSCQCVFSAHTCNIEVFTSFGSSKKPMVLSSSAKETLLWDSESGRILASFEDVIISSIALDPTNPWRVMIVDSKTNKLELWKFEPGKPKPTILAFEGHKDSITSISGFHSKPGLVSSSADKTIKIWDLTSQNCINTLEHDQPVSNFAIFRGDNHIVSLTKTGSYHVWQLEPTNKIFFQSTMQKETQFKFTILPSQHQLLHGNMIKSSEGTKPEFCYELDSVETVSHVSDTEELIIGTVGESLICFVGQISLLT